MDQAWDKSAFAEPEMERLETCDLCGAAIGTARTLFSKSGLSVQRCSRCGLMFANPRLCQDILWQRYSDAYFQNEYLPQHGEYHEQANALIQAPFLRELRRYVPAPGRLFEFGAAIGLFLAAARLEGWDVMGNELSPFAAEYARQHFDIPVLPGKAEEVNLPKGSFDAVALWETIEHVQSPRAVIGKAAELLRPGGVLALSTPNGGGLTFRLLHERWWVVSPKEHIYYFTPRTITRLLTEAGFEVKRIWTAGLDLYYLLNTVLGRTAMPLHIRLLAGASGPASGSPTPSIERQLLTIWSGSLRPGLTRLLVPCLSSLNLGDAMYVYAVRKE